MSSKLEFSKIRSLFWPIEKRENKKFIPMFFIFFLISLSYNILKTTKDTLIVTAPYSGAEAIPFLKVWAVLPVALLITFLFTKLSNKYSRENVFYIMVAIFLSFFFIFTFILYPFQDLLQANAICRKLENILPSGFSGFIAIFRNWILALYYVMAELWGTMILSVSFWGFANEISSVDEARRYYSLLGLGANVSTFFAGYLLKIMSSNIYWPLIPFGKTAWEQSVLYMNGSVIIIGIIIVIMFRFLNVTVISNKEMSHQPPPRKTSLKNSFSYLVRSKYLICIALMVIAYNVTVNLSEILWKNQVKLLYPTSSDYSIYMSKVTSAIGITATLIALIMTSGNILKRFKWSFSALLTPIFILTTGTLFFYSLFKTNFSSLSLGMMANSSLVFSTFLGSLQNCISRATKYTLFDATKEISFIPLSLECKIKGKAAIDGVGSRFGKSGGSIIYQSLLISCPSLFACTPYIAIIFFVGVGIWIISVLSLGKRFNSLVKEQELVTERI